MRLQQRAIPITVVDLLERFGSSMPYGRGAGRLFVDKAATRPLKEHFGSDRGQKFLERCLGVYAVFGECGLVITVAHQTRRFRRH